MVWSQITQVAILLSCLVGLGRGEPPHVSDLRRRWQFGNKIIWDECGTVVHSFIFNKHVDLWVQLESHDSELLSQTYNPSLLAEAAAGFCLVLGSSLFFSVFRLFVFVAGAKKNILFISTAAFSPSGLWSGWQGGRRGTTTSRGAKVGIDTLKNIKGCPLPHFQYQVGLGSS